MRLYDVVVLVTPDLTDEDAAKVAAEYKKILVDGGANVVKEEPWGKRRLAFSFPAGAAMTSVPPVLLCEAARTTPAGGTSSPSSTRAEAPR